MTLTQSESFMRHCFSCVQQAICLKCLWVFDAGVSFCWVFLIHVSVRLGCIWDIDEKGRGQNMAFFLSEGIVCIIGLSKCFISRAKWLCEICCAGFTELAEFYSSQDVLLRGVESPPFVLCLLCITYLNERLLLMWVSLGLQS